MFFFSFKFKKFKIFFLLIFNGRLLKLKKAFSRISQDFSYTNDEENDF